MFVCLFVCLSACLFVCVLVCLFICSFVYVFTLQVNLYALQCLLRMLPHLETSLDQVLTPFTEQLVPNLASQRANIVTLTSQILDGFRVHVGM